MEGTAFSVDVSCEEGGAKASNEDWASSLSFRFLLRTSGHAREASSTLPSMCLQGRCSLWLGVQPTYESGGHHATNAQGSRSVGKVKIPCQNTRP
jgi:hypothetical protein